MNIYFNGDNYNETLYNEFKNLSKLTDAEIQSDFRNSNSSFGNLVDFTLGADISSHYSVYAP